LQKKFEDKRFTATQEDMTDETPAKKTLVKKSPAKQTPVKKTPSKKQIQAKKDDTGSDTDTMNDKELEDLKKIQRKKANPPKKNDSDTDDMEIEVKPKGKSQTKPQTKKSPAKMVDYGSDTYDLVFHQPKKKADPPKKDDSDTDDMELEVKPKIKKAASVAAKGKIERRKSDTINDLPSKLPDILSDVYIYISEDLPAPTKKKQKRILVTFGGSPADHFYDEVTHFVSNGPWTEDHDEALKDRKKLKIIKTSWLEACEKNGERANENNHLLKKTK